MSLPDREQCLRPLQSLVVSLLLSLASTHLCSWTGSVLSQLNSLTRRFPRFPPSSRSLCSSHLRCNGHSLLLSSYFFRIGKIENPSCSAVDTCPRTALISFCTVQLRTLCAALSLATLYLSKISGPGHAELPGFWGSKVFRNAFIPQKGSGNNNRT